MAKDLARFPGFVPVNEKSTLATRFSYHSSVQGNGFSTSREELLRFAQQFADTNSWDTLPLFQGFSGWLRKRPIYDAGSRGPCATPSSDIIPGANQFDNYDDRHESDECCANTVQIGGRCWLNGTVNYGTFVFTARLCHDFAQAEPWWRSVESISRVYTLDWARRLIRAYKRFGPTPEAAALPIAWVEATFGGGPRAVPSVPGKQAEMRLRMFIEGRCCSLGLCVDAPQAASGNSPLLGDMGAIIVIGTRPEAIKLAPVVLELERHRANFKTEICVTGQHREMLDQMLQVFGLRPDYDLGVMKAGQDLAEVTAACLTGLDRVLRRERPDVVLVQGDTTTTFAASLAAYYRHIPVGHIEAGLRTGKKYDPFPEEVNRRLTTHLSDFHFAPTDVARNNLLLEGVSPESILVTGNTVIDALLLTQARLAEEPTLAVDRLGPDRWVAHHPSDRSSEREFWSAISPNLRGNSSYCRETTRCAGRLSRSPEPQRAGPGTRNSRRGAERQAARAAGLRLVRGLHAARLHIAYRFRRDSGRGTLAGQASSGDARSLRAP